MRGSLRDECTLLVPAHHPRGSRASPTRCTAASAALACCVTAEVCDGGGPALQQRHGTTGHVGITGALKRRLVRRFNRLCLKQHTFRVVPGRRMCSWMIAMRSGACNCARKLVGVRGDAIVSSTQAYAILVVSPSWLSGITLLPGLQSALRMQHVQFRVCGTCLIVIIQHTNCYSAWRGRNKHFEVHIACNTVNEMNRLEKSIVPRYPVSSGPGKCIMKSIKKRIKESLGYK